MKKLELNQIENIDGGNACHDRVYGWATGVFVGSLFGGPVSAMIGGTVAVVVMAGAAACGGTY